MITHEEVMKLYEKAGTRGVTDYECFSGSTIKEKHEGVYLKFVEMLSVLEAKGAKGQFWAIASPDLASIFEPQTTAGFAPMLSDTFAIALGIKYVANVNNRWRMYSDPEMESGKVLFGVSEHYLPHSVFEEHEDCRRYATLYIANFII